jgi:hypothetical protein
VTLTWSNPTAEALLYLETLQQPRHHGERIADQLGDSERAILTCGKRSIASRRTLPYGRE